MHFNFKWNIIILVIVAAVLVYRYGWPYLQHYKLHRQTVQAYESIARQPVPWKVYGTSEEGRNIYYWESGDSAETTLIFGAFHGDEQTGFHLVLRLAEELRSNPTLIHKRAVLVPVLNPDGLLKRTRTNANGVDINRNFPTEDWTPVYDKKNNYPGPSAASEKETAIAMQLIEEFKPARIISIHDALKMNNYNGPSLQLAERMAELNGYPAKADVGYPTPGSFGNYGGNARKIPLITLELPDILPDQAWTENREALIEAINFEDKQGD